MKELILVRHAKSDWGNEYLKDIDRPLNERGYQDAYLMSQWYSKNKPLPDSLLCSPATRAMNTALIFLRELSLPLPSLTLHDNIYESPASSILGVIHNAGRQQARLMVFGHNPGFTDLANQLSGDMFFENIPTCGIVSLSFNVKKWSAVEFKTGTVNYFQFPKEFKNIH